MSSMNSMDKKYIQKVVIKQDDGLDRIHQLLGTVGLDGVHVTPMRIPFINQHGQQRSAKLMKCTPRTKTLMYKEY